MAFKINVVAKHTFTRERLERARVCQELFKLHLDVGRPDEASPPLTITRTRAIGGESRTIVASLTSRVAQLSQCNYGRLYGVPTLVQSHRRKGDAKTSEFKKRYDGDGRGDGRRPSQAGAKSLVA